MNDKNGDIDKCPVMGHGSAGANNANQNWWS